MVFHIGEAHDMRRRLPFGILALVFLAVVDALDIERHDLLAHVPVQLTLDPDKGLVLDIQLLHQGAQRHVHEARHFLELLLDLRVLQIHVLGNGPDTGRRHAGRKNQTIAIQQTATVGRQLQSTRKAHQALTLEEVVAEDLHIGCTRAQAHKTQRQRSHDELAAPQRCFRSQQRAGGIEHAACHCAVPAAVSCTYCVMA